MRKIVICKGPEGGIYLDAEKVTAVENDYQAGSRVFCGAHQHFVVNTVADVLDMIQTALEEQTE